MQGKPAGNPPAPPTAPVRAGAFSAPGQVLEIASKASFWRLSCRAGQLPLPGLCLAVVGVLREFQDGGGECLGGFLGHQVPDSLKPH
jgi:hypothetical protein